MEGYLLGRWGKGSRNRLADSREVCPPAPSSLYNLRSECRLNKGQSFGDDWHEHRPKAR